jgi:hypothetical protein
MQARDDEILVLIEDVSEEWVELGAALLEVAREVETRLIQVQSHLILKNRLETPYPRS